SPSIAKSTSSTALTFAISTPSAQTGELNTSVGDKKSGSGQSALNRDMPYRRIGALVPTATRVDIFNSTRSYTTPGAKVKDCTPPELNKPNKSKLLINPEAKVISFTFCSPL